MFSVRSLLSAIVIAVPTLLSHPSPAEAQRQLVAAGEADIAVQPVSELLHVPGLDFAGALPAELQLIQIFAAAIRSNGMEPAGKR